MPALLRLLDEDLPSGRYRAAELAAAGAAVSALLPEPAVRFALPRAAEATAPPEARGLSRDGVRLLVAAADGVDARAGSATCRTCSRPATSSS